ncbi:hypothetical protein K1719_038930 [Acacia pycnantha]|nr:hypothetical protein K1719_038930 [Acacia pycnantha]
MSSTLLPTRLVQKGLATCVDVHLHIHLSEFQAEHLFQFFLRCRGSREAWSVDHGLDLLCSSDILNILGTFGTKELWTKQYGIMPQLRIQPDKRGRSLQQSEEQNLEKIFEKHRAKRGSKEQDCVCEEQLLGIDFLCICLNFLGSIEQRGETKSRTVFAKKETEFGEDF